MFRPPKPKKTKMNRLQKKLDRQERLREATKGSGLFLYQNVSSGELYLPKTSADGKKIVSKDGTFEGDTYFMCLVRDGNAKKIKDLNMKEEKLILDQPDIVTTKGVVEHVVCCDTKKKKLNECKEKQKDILINEDPMSNIEIISE